MCKFLFPFSYRFDGLNKKKDEDIVYLCTIIFSYGMESSGVASGIWLCFGFYFRQICATILAKGGTKP